MVEQPEVPVGSRVMRRSVVLLVTIVIAAAATFALWPDDQAASSSGTSALESARLPPVDRQPAPAEAPEPRFSRTMAAATTLPDSDPALDLCRGPVAIDLGADNPVLVAEHDYCGGSAWMPRLESGEAVELDGPGVDAGRYVVGDIALGTRGEARMSDLPAGTVVLQTCISDTQIVMVGLEPVEAPLGA